LRGRLPALICALLIATNAAIADGSSSGYGEGGPLAKYAPIISQFNDSGERLRI